ncbi:MAG: hypothetical protein HUU31_19255 [Anaerolineae bacterium]|nr:hypothetical protein [Anaerolineae bacterium]
MLKLEQITQINGRPNWIELSTDGHWAALQYGSEWRMVDALTGLENGRIHLPDAYWATVSPDGTALASMRGGVIRVAYLNSKQVTKACTYHGTKYYSDDVCFTADSQRLWTTLWNEDESGRLALLDAETLSEIASVPMPKARADDLDYWSEPYSILHIPSNTLALQHAGGDHLFGVFFFNQHGNQIKPHPLFVSPDSGDFRQMNSISFSASGQLFAGIDGVFLHVWRWWICS